VLVQVLQDGGDGEEREGGGHELEDPVKFIIRTWPWSDGAQGLPQVLLTVLRGYLRYRGGGGHNLSVPGPGQMVLKGSHMYRGDNLRRFECHSERGGGTD
jgi:hypothetical protein